MGSAIRESGIPRSEIFLVTKFWSTAHYDPESSLRESLKDMGLDYVDLVSCLIDRRWYQVQTEYCPVSHALAHDTDSGRQAFGTYV